MAKDKNYGKQRQYAEMLMERNAQNPNISQEQAAFLKKLAEYRHLLHSNPHQYFFNTKKTYEIDEFFALAHSQTYFQMIDLPFPKEMFDLLLQMKAHKEKQSTDFDNSIEQYAYTSEAVNTLIERYLQKIDDEKDTLYCPRGELRDASKDPVQLTIEKLNTAQERILPYQRKIQQELDKLNTPSKHKASYDMDL